MSIRVANVVRTCEVCPTQWEGFLDDGRMIYVRYRWGYLSVRLSPKPTRVIQDAVRGEEVFGQQLGDGFDGALSYAKLVEATSGRIHWPILGCTCTVVTGGAVSVSEDCPFHGEGR